MSNNGDGTFTYRNLGNEGVGACRSIYTIRSQGQVARKITTAVKVFLKMLCENGEVKFIDRTEEARFGYLNDPSVEE